MSRADPPVSVGLPVRNGMPFLPESLASITTQTFGDFELLVCDNASTDATQEVVREFARADDRVRYVRVDKDAGASANFNRCFAETRGALFTWAASDDRFLPRYLEVCRAFLAQADRAMCIPAVGFIDESGTRMGLVRQPSDLSAEDVSARLRSYLARRSWYMVYGLAWRDALSHTGLFPARFGPDVILLWELLLRYRIGTLDEVLLEYRRYQVKESDTVWRGIRPESGAEVPGWLHVRLFRDLLDRCGADEIDATARTAAHRALARWLVSGMFRDLVFDDLRDELWRRGRGTRPFYDACLVSGMTLLRPTRAIRNAGRAPILRTRRHRAGDATAARP